MSTKIGTLQAPGTARSIWPAAVIASLLLLTVGVGAFFLARDQATPTATVGGAAVSPWIAVGVTPGMQEAIVAAREAAEVSGTLSAGTTAANTPTELSGGIRHKLAGGALGTTTPSELSGGLGNGRPAEIYDRHQRG